MKKVSISMFIAGYLLFLGLVKITMSCFTFIIGTIGKDEWLFEMLIGVLCLGFSGLIFKKDEN